MVSRGNRTSAPVRIRIKHRGDLAAFGYRDIRSTSTPKRQHALRAAAREYGWLRLIRKLNALFVFNKRRFPALAARFQADRNFASSQYARAKKTR